MSKVALRTRTPAHVEELARAIADEERPMTGEERDGLLASLARTLGWSEERIMAEALLRLHEVLSFGKAPFDAYTPSPKPMKEYRKKARALLRALPSKRAA